MTSRTASAYCGVALLGCTSCFGRGFREAGHHHIETPCPCTSRGIFRIVLAAYRFHSASSGQSLKTNMAQFNRCANRRGLRSNGRKAEEFMADVWLCAKRTLTPRQWTIFRRHHIAGEAWTSFGIEKGTFFHEAYRLEQILGKVFRELKPYALFPTDEYFQETTRETDVRPFFPPVTNSNGVPLIPPLATGPAAPRVKVPVASVVVVMPAPMIPAAPVQSSECYIREWFKQGLGLRSIALKLQAMGIPTPGGRPQWMASDVKTILLAKRAA